MLETRRFKGLTLLELITTLTIVVVLAILSTPLFIGFIQRYRVSTAADNLYFYLQYAKSEAIKRNANVYVSFTTGDTWCYGINVGSTCNCTVANNCGLATVSYSSAAQISLSITGMSSNAIYFEGTHGSASSSSTATFTRYGQSDPLVTISIGKLGGLTMCATDISGYAEC